ncbi:MAG: hypothetical protein HC923_06230 [Myxococcales bacterium]|nr:hypothetical protein [Myxococcales bacterium]
MKWVVAALLLAASFRSESEGAEEVKRVGPFLESVVGACESVAREARAECDRATARARETYLGQKIQVEGAAEQVMLRSVRDGVAF